jgi:hypothetical protein
MDACHPWTKYEVARLRDEERLLRARDAMRARELRESPEGVDAPVRAVSWFERLRRRDLPSEQPSVKVRPA